MGDCVKNKLEKCMKIICINILYNCYTLPTPAQYIFPHNHHPYFDIKVSPPNLGEKIPLHSLTSNIPQFSPPPTSFPSITQFNFSFLSTHTHAHTPKTMCDIFLYLFEYYQFKGEGKNFHAYFRHALHSRCLTINKPCY